MRAFLGIDANVPAPMLQEEIDNVLCKQADILAQTGLPKPVLREMALTLVKEQFDDFYANQAPELIGAFDYMAQPSVSE